MLPSVRLLRRRTKIVATVGPASRSPDVLNGLIRAGVNVFRLNFSHGTHDQQAEAYQAIRAVAATAGEPIAVLADLCGPKIRAGTFDQGSVTLTDGDGVTVTTRDVIGGPGLIPSQYAALAADVQPGDRILLDDGLLELRVESVSGTEIGCKVVHGGVLKDKKGMNLPGVSVSSPALTEKDRLDAIFALDLGVDFLALSFVRRPEDVSDLKRLIEERGLRTPVIAKIEKPEAVQCLDAILAVADGLMVARGDLGVEMPPETVPIVQRELVRQARRACKPVIVATQMLESMIHQPIPTRAEVSDVSTAVFSGTDAVMLSAETATGAYPIKAVEMMDRVARQVEGYQWAEGAFAGLSIEEENARASIPLPLYEAMARSTAQLSRDLRARAVCVRTTKGTSAAVVSATRPAAPMVVLTRDPSVARRMNLYWGAVPRTVETDDFELPKQAARQEVMALGLAEAGQYILLLAGFGKGQPMLSVVKV
ncbi:MAG: pyruvate kinase [Planctomycetia bacterium]|nr:pyruvate kinase [Planctomycetia bacterium]